jgi:hypothetical protein
MRSLFILELVVGQEYKNIITQQCFHDEFMSHATMKPIMSSRKMPRNFLPVLTKCGIPRRIFIKIPIIQSSGNTFWFESR